MATTYRTAGAWGAGKGSDLTAVEVDTNFYELVTRVTDIENNPPEPISIDHFVIEGTLLTIVLSNGDEQGPFVLPVAQWRWTGEWQPIVQYFAGDILTEGGNTYFVRVQHISDTVFDPGLFTIDGQVYILILSKAQQPYDVGLFYNDNLPHGEEIIMLHVAARTFTASANFDGSQAYLEVAPTDTTITLPIYKNIDLVGHIQFEVGSQVGAFATVDPDSGVTWDAGDRLSISLPYEDDSTAARLAVTITTIVAGL